MPRPYPAHPYPYGAPPPVVFGAPFPVYYPPPPPRRSKRNTKRSENIYSQPPRNNRGPVHHRQPLAERYEDVNRSDPSQTGKRKQNRVKFKDPPPPAVPNGFYSYPVYPFPNYYEDPYRSSKRESKYKVTIFTDISRCYQLTLYHTIPCFNNQWREDFENIVEKKKMPQCYPSF